MTYDKIAMLASTIGERLRGHRIIGVMLPYDTSSEIPWNEFNSSASWLPFDKVYEAGSTLMLALNDRMDIERRIEAVRVLRMLQAEGLFIILGCTSLNPQLKVGSYVVINDHINCTGENPLWGPNDERLGPRYPNMNEPYDSRMSTSLQRNAETIGMSVEGVVYGRFKEIEFEESLNTWSKMGIDVIGEGLVDEVISAVHCGLPVAAVGAVESVWSGRRAATFSPVNPSSMNFKEMIQLINQCVLQWRIG